MKTYWIAFIAYFFYVFSYILYAYSGAFDLKELDYYALGNIVMFVSIAILMYLKKHMLAILLFCVLIISNCYIKNYTATIEKINNAILCSDMPSSEHCKN